jgi:hypothetical protein
MEDFNEEIFEENNEIDTIIKEAEMEEKMYELKVKLANENYDMIVKNGIDFDLMEYRGIDIKQSIKTLNEMLELFEELEEYEKCANISKILLNYTT